MTHQRGTIRLKPHQDYEFLWFGYPPNAQTRYSYNFTFFAASISALDSSAGIRCKKKTLVCYRCLGNKGSP
ncbi:uncharacterized protein PHALS_07463 [Plasmopara halstedii]|uniref:Uncharacterized protein n=1 Tax=Plasmopara halstedii TaxID=4781 RepID=A0A0P1B7K3_PLAHL|nr:uncharacterized protein PHALS_07463 [Plasmopara halstedii]CEG49711.1 hypothetical protein PHALS_07463 [Plasmopara halstedii]|eukprot:XP_024586080.1 hypothetical protein PHALS_07463 [Plasmopara halstedii]